MSDPFFHRNLKRRPENRPTILFIKNIFGFTPGNIFLYIQALRHRSAAMAVKEGVKDSNERLEFLGDAVLGVVVADYLFQRFPFREEGFLTETRSKIVSRASLNRLGLKLGVDKHLFLGSDTPRNAVHAIIGDAVEALIGAMYLDKGYDFTKKIIIKYILDLHMDLQEIVEKEVNFKSRIIEWGQHHKKKVEFLVAEEIGLKNHQRQYRIVLQVDGQSIAEAIDFSIKGAEQRASEIGMESLIICSE